MARKSKKQDDQQLFLFNLEESKESNFVEFQKPSDEVQIDSEEDWESEDDDFGMDADSNDLEVEPPAPELITLRLLRRAIAAQNPDDEIMRDFGEYVLPNLLRVAIGTTAKGGKYFERKEQEYYERQIQEGRETIRPISRRSADDQSLNTHLLNGLFPANQIARRLEELDTTIQRIFRPKPERRRLAIAGFILHDFEKFNYNRFPSMPEGYKAVEKDKIRKLSIDDHRAILDVIIRELGLDQFLNPEDPQSYKNQINGIRYIAYNAQRKDDTNLNTAEFGLGRDSNIYVELSNLARLADLLASIIKHPQDAESQSLYSTLHELSDGQLQLTYHSIAENHGVLTNVVNNAVMDEFTSVNMSERKYYEPLLYLPTGIIYLKLKDAPSISAANFPDQVVAKVKEICIKELNPELKPGDVKPVNKGFLRDGKGLKYAEYCEQLFDDLDLMKVALQASQSLIRNSKATERSKSLLEFQKKGVLNSKFDFEFGERLLIDQLAEFGDLITRKIWSSRVAKIQGWAKTNKKKFSLGDLESEDFLVLKIAEHLGLSEYLPQIREIQKINERLKELKLKGNTGGLPLEWYYLAAQYIKANSGQEDIIEVGLQIIECVKNLVSPVLKNFEDLQVSLKESSALDSGIKGDGWDDLRDWVRRVIMLPGNPATSQDKFFEELKNYNAAKQQRRGKQLICSITHSAYTVKEQMESGVLFTPQVYTNKQMLFGSNAKRNISSIAAIEFMLRQILMSETQEVGKKFEDGKYRYLFFYPTYYFSPETNRFLHEAYDHISSARFDTGLRNHFISKDSIANLSLENYQMAGVFKLQDNLASNAYKGRIFRLNYSENQPMTFYFMALPPEKRGKTDPTDTESWVMPAWLAFAFPMILDVKTVVSESPIPPCTDGTDFEQTVFLDSAPQAFRMLTQESHFRLDSILEGWEHNGKHYTAPLNSLTAAYAINLDVNARQTKNGYNPNWGKLAELARDFETSPLYVFSYLKRYTREKQLDTPGLPKIRLYAYQFYPCFDPYVAFKSEELQVMHQASHINHPKKLTELYRVFYRARRKKGKPTPANAILKPIDEAAAVILKADLCKTQTDALIDYVAARLCSLMNRVHSSTAEGRWVFKNSERDQEREAIQAFARYFVEDVFRDTFNSDRARLAGRQLNLIRDTCEYLYRLEDDKDYKERKAKGVSDSEDDNADDQE
ncbi:MAG: type I-D CRISPR-associated protein Cas10d/Csc3 [Leptolyngbyaceae cyanobacterium SU_3_3]|nr:type I-D CRISPR-associated protein Cas10d/Csc3 [Leptolyngbyaceae cyanobacterium SU_3_3]